MRHSLALSARLALAASTIAMASCSDGASFDQTTRPDVQLENFSEQERMAARTLSTSNSATFAEVSGPYQQALLCKVAIETVAERLRQSGTQTQAQAQAIQQAQTIFDQRVQSLGSNEGKSVDAIRANLTETRADSGNIAEQAQMAVACIQDLQ